MPPALAHDGTVALENRFGGSMATFVLVHGAFLGGWCWSKVAARLRVAGHEVWTPTLTGCGDRHHLLTPEVGLALHVRDLVATFAHEGLRDVVLVGHSYGGTVITAAAAELRDRVAKLIYLDAQAPIDGQTASGAMADGTAEALGKLAGGGEGWRLDPIPLSAVGIVEPTMVEAIGKLRHPHPMRTLLEPVHAPESVLGKIPRAYIACARHEGLVATFGTDPLAPFVERARAEGWPLTTIDAPHDAMTTDPELVAEVLDDHV
jgi:pimeloyl-ACP methyl ester carboxylesterase